MGGNVIDTEAKQILRQGISQGRDLTLLTQVCRKLAKGKSPEAIAEDLEEELPEIERLCAAAARFAPDYDIDKIFEELHRTKKQNQYDKE